MNGGAEVWKRNPMLSQCKLGLKAVPDDNEKVIELDIMGGLGVLEVRMGSRRGIGVLWNQLHATARDLRTYVFANDLFQRMCEDLPREHLDVFFDFAGLGVGEAHDGLEELLVDTVARRNPSRLRRMRFFSRSVDG